MTVTCQILTINIIRAALFMKLKQKTDVSSVAGNGNVVKLLGGLKERNN